MRAAGGLLLWLLALALLQLPVSDHEFLLRLDPTRAARTVYGLNPFPEAREIGRYIRQHAPEGSRVAVLGSEPEIYFYAKRRSASAHVLMYEVIREHDYAPRMQE